MELGADFLFAHLHAWWSRSAQGARLDDLSRAATTENFLHLLQNMGIAVIDEADKVTAALLLRHYECLTQLERLCPAAARRYVLMQRMVLESDNLKALLNYRYFPERIGSYHDVLIKFPRAVADYDDVEGLLSAPSTSQFIGMLPLVVKVPEVIAIIEQLDRDRNIMAAECALDNLAYQAEQASAEALPAGMRRVARELLTYEIDIINVMTLLRNANFYRMGHEELNVAWMNGGSRITHGLWARLADEKDAARVFAQLPSEFANVMRQHAGEELNQLENRLRSQLMRKARRYFYDAGNPDLALPAYTWMLRFETVNLGRIFEGIRFSLPARAIREMLIE